MRKIKSTFVTVVAAGVCICFLLNPVSAFASSTLMKKGSQGSSVTSLQKDLKSLGYLSAEATGYYGDLTAAAVKNLQKSNGIAADGIAGNKTLDLIKRLKGNSSRGSSSSQSGVLKKGMKGSAVTELQKDLRKLGYLSAQATGLYGDLTVAAVKNLQKRQGITADGVVGPATSAVIKKLVGQSGGSTASRGAKTSSGYLTPWFSEASKIFAIGKVATVYDIATGSSFKLKRTYGYNHADCETLTAEDTTIMKKLYGGQWSWNRRAVIVDVDGTKMAASLAGMPHAGSEKAAANKYISSRSGGYGRGANLDAVKGNSMSGVVDLHFYGSKTHGTNKVNSAHQNAVKKAAEWAKKNY